MFQLMPARRLLAAAAVAIIVAACGAGAGATPTAAPAASQPAASQAAAGSGQVYMLNAVNDATLGTYVTGEAGKALYVFAMDKANTSNCSGTCAQTWPPFTLEPGETAVAGAGVTGTVGTLMRSDGSTQVTLNGKPVYYYSGDSAAGQTNGQGYKGLWYVAGPDGAPVNNAAPTGGYGY